MHCYECIKLEPRLFSRGPVWSSDIDLILTITRQKIAYASDYLLPRAHVQISQLVCRRSL